MTDLLDPDDDPNLTPEEQQELDDLIASWQYQSPAEPPLTKAPSVFNVESFRQMMDGMCGDEFTHMVGHINRDLPNYVVTNQCVREDGHWGRHDCGSLKWTHGFKSHFSFKFSLKIFDD